MTLAVIKVYWLYYLKVAQDPGTQLKNILHEDMRLVDGLKVHD